MRRLWPVAAALVFVGCLAKPPLTDEILRESLPETTKIPQAWGEGASSGEVDDAWLASFGDASLDSLVFEVLENNTDLHQAAARVAVAKETVVVVGSRLKPRVGAKIGGATTKDFSSSSPVYTNAEYAGLVWELDVWGRLRSQRDAAKQDFEAAELDYKFARLSLVATTAKLWYQLTEVLRIKQLVVQSVEIYTDLLELVQQRRSSGKASDFELMQAKAALASAQSDLRAVDADFAAVRRALELLLGRYPSADLEAQADFVPVPPPVAAGVPAPRLILVLPPVRVTR